jgi:hypothetical protein
LFSQTYTLEHAINILFTCLSKQLAPLVLTAGVTVTKKDIIVVSEGMIIVEELNIVLNVALE